jgi:hypothetical protein
MCFIEASFAASSQCNTSTARLSIQQCFPPAVPQSMLTRLPAYTKYTTLRYAGRVAVVARPERACHCGLRTSFARSCRYTSDSVTSSLCACAYLFLGVDVVSGAAADCFSLTRGSTTARTRCFPGLEYERGRSAQLLTLRNNIARVIAQRDLMSSLTAGDDCGSYAVRRTTVSGVYGRRRA